MSISLVIYKSVLPGSFVSFLTAFAGCLLKRVFNVAKAGTKTKQVKEEVEAVRYLYKFVSDSSKSMLLSTED